jgi:hypothetical protein
MCRSFEVININLRNPSFRYMIIEICNFVIENEVLYYKSQFVERRLIFQWRFHLSMYNLWASLYFYLKAENCNLIDRLYVNQSSCVLPFDETFQLLENVLYRCMFRSLSLGNLVLVIEKFEVGDGMFG